MSSIQEQVDLLNGYEDWKAVKKQEALDLSAEAYLRDTAKEQALDTLVRVVDYIDAAIEDYPYEEPVATLLKEIKYVAT